MIETETQPSEIDMRKLQNDALDAEMNAESRVQEQKKDREAFESKDTVVHSCKPIQPKPAARRYPRQSPLLAISRTRKRWPRR